MFHHGAPGWTCCHARSQREIRCRCIEGFLLFGCHWATKTAEDELYLFDDVICTYMGWSTAFNGKLTSILYIHKYIYIYMHCIYTNHIWYVCANWCWSLFKRTASFAKRTLKHISLVFEGIVLQTRNSLRPTTRWYTWWPYGMGSNKMQD